MYLTLFTLTVLSSYCGLSQAILCYVCESYTDFRCLDPYDHRAFPQVRSSLCITTVSTMTSCRWTAAPPYMLGTSRRCSVRRGPRWLTAAT